MRPHSARRPTSWSASRWGRAARRAERERLRTLGDLDAAALVLRDTFVRLCQAVADPDADLRRLVLDQLSEMRLTVADDGRGIAEGAAPGVGLVSMRERAAELGRECTVRSVAGHGTQVVAVLPLGSP